MLAARLKSLIVAGASAVFAVSGVCQAEPPGTSDDKAFGERVRAYILSHPEVLEEAVQRLGSREDAAQGQSASAAIRTNLRALEADPRDAVLGNPNGRITIVEFFDYRCPFCKASEPDLERFLAANPDVRLILKQLAILDAEDDSHISEDASRAAIAANVQGRFAAVHRALLARKNLDEDGIVAVLRAQGVNVGDARSVETSQTSTAIIADARALAQALGIDGTPAFIVGDRMVPGVDMDQLRLAVARAREREAAAPTAP